MTPIARFLTPLEDQAIQLLKRQRTFFSEKFMEAIDLDGQNAIFYDNRATAYWALQRFVDGVLLLPQLIWAEDAKKVDLCVHFFAFNDR